MRYKRRYYYAGIKPHVTELKIQNFASCKEGKYGESCLTIVGMADGHCFYVKTDGHMKIGEIVEKIAEMVRS